MGPENYQLKLESTPGCLLELQMGVSSLWVLRVEPESSRRAVLGVQVLFLNLLHGGL